MHMLNKDKDESKSASDMDVIISTPSVMTRFLSIVCWACLGMTQGQMMWCFVWGMMGLEKTKIEKGTGSQKRVQKWC